MSQPKIYHIFVLKEYLKQIIGLHYPYDIIYLIIMINHRSTNKIYIWGKNSLGQLGLGTIENHDKPQKLKLTFNVKSIQCGQNHTIALSSTGNIWSWGANYSG